MSGNSVAQMMRRLGKSTGLTVYCHKFRHSFATLFCQRTPNSILLADILGHETLEMSKRYVHLSGVEALKSISVMDELLGGTIR